MQKTNRKNKGKKYYFYNIINQLNIKVMATIKIKTVDQYTTDLLNGYRPNKEVYDSLYKGIRTVLENDVWRDPEETPRQDEVLTLCSVRVLIKFTDYFLGNDEIHYYIGCKSFGSWETWNEGGIDNVEGWQYIE